MALIKKIFLVGLMLCTSNIAFAHLIYAPNDIPLLDNRFRIDPYTDEITFILNHNKGKQRVVLVRPDGSKMYKKRHPESVAWVSSKTQDIITIQAPMPGPWQAIAILDGPTRIKLLSKVQLKINKLPLKLYSREYITTHTSLYYDNKIMTDANYIKNARLSVKLVGPTSKVLALYKDKGRSYDALAFDGNLTARVFINLLPGRYLLSIQTKNDVFIRAVNKDIVVAQPPISYLVTPLQRYSNIAVFKFKINAKEIDPNSISIDGLIRDQYHNKIAKLVIHADGKVTNDVMLSVQKKLAYKNYIFSGKVFATTKAGREIELQLRDQPFELVAPKLVPKIIPKIVKTEETLIAKIEEEIEEEVENNSMTFIILGGVSVFVLCLGGLAFFFLRRRKQKSLEIVTDEKAKDAKKTNKK
ncbi:hypothetical protein PCNPT3_11125 [Psychromonas sp. CNPT3]|uniref:hypothetical protein n=1 Tax=Psychromonas sp. CNPT3 TaxID=314282 RepID=UPI00006E9E85|nr:hypothetical protein [Psychromonas sp. CNPT3]AGH82161.1 hypothetical protein PCNPT3_11125 [Psychromonas sp. CNPT3]